MTYHKLNQSELPGRFKEEGLDILRFKSSDVPDGLVQQLADKSRQPHIMEFEGHEDVGTDQEPGRFRDVASYRAWAASKPRILYFIADLSRSDDSPDLGGIIWFGHRQNTHAPGYTVTFGIRHYAADTKRGWGQYVGRGYGAPFVEATHKDVREFYPNEKIWLDLVEENEAGMKLYVKAGYRELTRHQDEEHPDRRRIVMVNDDILKLQ